LQMMLRNAHLLPMLAVTLQRDVARAVAPSVSPCTRCLWVCCTLLTGKKLYYMHFLCVFPYRCSFSCLFPFYYSGLKNELLIFEEVGGSPEGLVFKTVTMVEV